MVDYYIPSLDLQEETAQQRGRLSDVQGEEKEWSERKGEVVTLYYQSRSRGDSHLRAQPGALEAVCNSTCHLKRRAGRLVCQGKSLLIDHHRHQGFSSINPSIPSFGLFHTFSRKRQGRVWREVTQGRP